SPSTSAAYTDWAEKAAVVITHSVNSGSADPSFSYQAMVFFLADSTSRSPSPSTSAENTDCAASAVFEITCATGACATLSHSGATALDASRGQLSSPSCTPSPSSSGSALLPIPSLSVSTHSAGSKGKASSVSAAPSSSASPSSAYTRTDTARLIVEK